MATNETEEENAERMKKIRLGAHKTTEGLKQALSKEEQTPQLPPSETEFIIDDPISEEDPCEDAPLTSESDVGMVQYERRNEQGLGSFPFESSSTLVRLGTDGQPYNPDLSEVLRVVSGWFVKKDNKFFDVNNLQTSYSSQDIKQVVIQRVRVAFPMFSMSDNSLKDFFRVLLDPPVGKLNPEESIPVWSGSTHCFPANSQKIIFKDGVASVNLWSSPNYRQVKGTKGTAFDAFLAYVIPKEEERDVFLNWLAWSLKYEAKKPQWSVMLYSQKQGTGKTVLTDVCKELFGVVNTSKINGVSKLVARFNKEVLQHKLVVVEEVEVKKGSKEANAIKTLITEDSTTVEAKGLPSSVENINCAFLLTTNHLPLWLEEADRRFFILNFNHEGYNNGGKDYSCFTGLVGALKEQVKTRAGIKGIYDDLMDRDLTDFDAMSLDVGRFSTELMVELRSLSPDVVRQQVEEALEQNFIVFVPVELAGKIVSLFAYREANAQTHLFLEMGWKKKRFAWDGGTQKWAWVKPSANDPYRGKVWVEAGQRIPSLERLPKVQNWPTSQECDAGYEKMWQQVWRVKSLVGQQND